MSETGQQGDRPGESTIAVDDVHRALAEAATDLIAVVDAQGRIVCASDAVRYVLGYEPAEVHGRNISDFIGADATAAARACIESGRARATFNQRGRVRGKDGRPVAVRVNSAPVTTAGGAVRGLVVVMLPDSEEEEAADAPADELPQPTARELEVLGLLANGYTGTEVARKLHLSPDTVRNHARSAREKLGAKTRAHAIAIAVDRGLIEV